MAGFAYFHTPELIGPAVAELTGWARDGKVSLPETVLDGIERYPEALQFMFEGGNVGKLMVKAR
jgi:NADPH-dependent curcumin reductase